MAESPSGKQFSPLTCVLIGITLGSIASIVLVAYMNKQAALKKLTKKRQRKGPNSPHVALDDEKAA